MNLRKNKIRFTVTGIGGAFKPSNRIYKYYYSYKPFAGRRFTKWMKGGVGLMLAALVILGVFVAYLPADGSKKTLASVLHSSGDLKTVEYNYTDKVSFEAENIENTYSAPGAIGVSVFKFKLAAMDNVRFRALVLKVNNTDCDYIKNPVLVDENGREYDGDCNDGYVKFDLIYRGFFAGDTGTFIMKIDLSSELHLGNGFYFDVEGADDINLTENGKKVYLKLDYPLTGPLVSVVGGKVVF